MFYPLSWSLNGKGIFVRIETDRVVSYSLAKLLKTVTLEIIYSLSCIWLLLFPQDFTLTSNWFGIKMPRDKRHANSLSFYGWIFIFFFFASRKGSNTLVPYVTFNNTKDGRMDSGNLGKWVQEPNICPIHPIQFRCCFARTRRTQRRTQNRGRNRGKKGKRGKGNDNLTHNTRLVLLQFDSSSSSLSLFRSLFLSFSPSLSSQDDSLGCTFSCFCPFSSLVLS